MTDLTSLDEKTLIKKRSSLKSKITSFSNYINKYKTIKEPTNKDIIELHERIEKAETVFDEYNEVQTQLEIIVDKPDDQYKERDNFEQNYYSILSNAKCLLRNDSPDAKTTRCESVNNQAGNSNESFQNSNKNPVKLPDIKLPTFSGSYEQWLEYRDTFRSLIHDNKGITNIQKFHYLRASLEGNASHVIKSLEFSEDNYITAWELLCKRFDNKNILIHNHLDALFNVEKINKASSAKLRTLVDTINKHLRALEILNEKVEFWDTLIIHLITKILDDGTLAKWEEYKTSKENLSLSNMYDFLKIRADLLERLEVNHDKNEKRYFAKTKSLFASNPVNSSNKETYSCVFCQGQHKQFQCEQFLKMSVSERVEQAKKHKLCLNCLRTGHFAKQCHLYGSCKKCNKKHNTLLHSEVREQKQSAKDDANNSVALTSNNLIIQEHTLLSTVLVNIFDENKVAHPVRALLDCGSQSCFITEALCRRINAKFSSINLSVSGLNESTCNVRHKSTVTVWSRNNNFNIKLSCLVLPRITGTLPIDRIDITELNIPKNLNLADPTFYNPGPIEMLIGAEVFWEIICNGHINLGHNRPVLQNTKFGWVVSGKVSGVTNRQNIICNFSRNGNIDIQDQLEQFFKLEDVSNKCSWSQEENDCEKYFIDTTKRLQTGRFQVTIPLKDSVDKLGDSYEQAEKRFFSLERKFHENPVLRSNYREFLKQYEVLGHMTKLEELKQDISSSNVSYYLPHHGVLRENSLTTKLRVVFDASARTTTGSSFNDLQMVGPTIQDDLFSILLRFRQHSFVFTADVEKMYRQVMIAPEQRSLQRILWREQPDQTLNIYTLNTVTYGTASAPFLAIRCLKELAEKCRNSLPDIAEVINHDFYVDDLISGCSTLDQAKRMCAQLSNVLKTGCFPLRKWRSNNPETLEHLSNDTTDVHILELGENETVKTLGLNWNSAEDKFAFSINHEPQSSNVNKRQMLSCIAKIFDPLGLLSPCVIIAKIMLQRLWEEKLSWDEPVSSTLNSQWTTFVQELSSLNRLRINRHVMCHNPQSIELHFFSDASENAYGGCIYVRTISYNNEIYSNLLCSKSKVAPIKPTTIPRLELCGAHVVAKLADKILNSLRLKPNRCVFWTDSKIVLGWINTSANLLKPFVRNRIVEIQDITGVSNWYYVPTKDNPADLVSRGVSPSLIENSDLWWYGPYWLRTEENTWPNEQRTMETLPELKSETKVLTSIITNTYFPFERFSNLSRLKHCCAYILRFKHNSLAKGESRQAGPLKIKEIHEAFMILIRIAQRNSFSEEFNYLHQGKPVGKKSKLLSLNPFLDNDGIIRVGGRLTNSQFNFDKKHPILLSSKHYLTKLVFKAEHEVLFHAGPQQMLFSLRERFWPISGRNLAKLIVRECITCCKFRAQCIQPIMGNLPASRLFSGFPFQATGLDYAGPIFIKDRKGRGSKLIKSYICLFVCFSTKCLHLELVSDLSTNTFLLAFKRFIARRGKPTHVYSDNGTTFVGANRELNEVKKFLYTDQSKIEESINNFGITWHFNPAYAPTFGGLWEAGVKSTKHHLKRIMGNAHLTFEECTTLLAQIEAILNSRPLTPLSTDPSDPTPLTPAHFMVGRPLTATPEVNIEDVPIARLSRYQRVEQLRQHFWRRWRKDYVSELQQRSKWKCNQGALKEGALVLVKEENLPVLDWRLGRIVELFPGTDNVSRVASVKTSSGIIRRAFTKLCPLPIEEENTEL